MDPLDEEGDDNQKATVQQSVADNDGESENEEEYEQRPLPEKA